VYSRAAFPATFSQQVEVDKTPERQLRRYEAVIVRGAGSLPKKDVVRFDVLMERAVHSHLLDPCNSQEAL